MSEPDKPYTPPPPPQYGAYPGSYPPPPPQPYAGYTPPQAAPKNGLGIAALVIAIFGLVFCWTIVGGIILGLCALIIGFLARGRVKRGEATNGGVATAGIVLGVLAIIVSLVFIPIWVGIFNEVGGSDYLDCLNNSGNDQRAIEQCAEQFRDHLETEFSVTISPTP
jgi:hypothetical protein